MRLVATVLDSTVLDFPGGLGNTQHFFSCLVAVIWFTVRNRNHLEHNSCCYRPLKQLKIVRRSSPQELTRHSLLRMVFRGTRWESWMVWEVRRPLMASEMGI